MVSVISGRSHLTDIHEFQISSVWIRYLMMWKRVRWQLELELNARGKWDPPLYVFIHGLWFALVMLRHLLLFLWFWTKKNKSFNCCVQISLPPLNQLWTNQMELWTNQMELWTNQIELWTNQMELWTNQIELWTNQIELWTNQIELWTNQIDWPRHLALIPIITWAVPKP